MNFFRILLHTFLDFLFPKSSKVLLLEALTPGEILKILPPAKETGSENILALFDYTDPLTRELIWELKYKGSKVVAEKLGGILYDVLLTEVSERALFEGFRSPCLIPMPISDKRRNERGYNQTELLCIEIKKKDIQNKTESLLEYLPGHLVKHHHTESQTSTSTRKERLENLKDSMHVEGSEAVKSRNVILIDDVTTTGATFIEAKRALKAVGVKSVLCVALAH